MIAIVAALEWEIRGIRKSMNLTNEDRILLLSGMGRERTTQALNLLFQSHQPSAVISTGFAGALQQGLQLGEIVLAQRIFCLNAKGYGEGLQSDKELLRQAMALLKEMGLPYRLGAILTTSRIITEAKEKWQLGQLLPAIAVDMESYWVAQAALAYGIPFIVARVVLDTIDETLPPLNALLDGEGKLRGIRALIYFSARPWQLLKLIKLAGKSKEAGERLANFVSALAAKLLN